MPRVTDWETDYDLEDDERRLERAQQAREERANSLPTMTDVDVDAVPWMHVESDGELADDDSVAEGTDLEDAIDGFLEHFNEHDLDGCLDLLSDDCETPGLDRADEDLPTALGDLWERRPTCQVTPAEVDGEPSAMLWEVGHDGRWWRLAVVHVDVNGDTEINCISFDDSPDIVERTIAEPPESRLDEGATWREWEEGVAPDD